VHAGSDRDAWVLVVDDEEDVRESMSEVLASAGYAVRTAADGEAALNAIRIAADPPDLVLLDLLLPRLAGREVLRVLGADHRAIPVVVVTGIDPEPGDLVELSGVKSVLRKPVAASDLLAAVRTHVRAR